MLLCWTCTGCVSAPGHLTSHVASLDLVLLTSQASPFTYLPKMYNICPKAGEREREIFALLYLLKSVFIPSILRMLLVSAENEKEKKGKW